MRALPQGVWMLDVSGKTLEANPVVERWLESRSLTGTNVDEWIVGGDWSVPGGAEIEIRSKSGIVRQVEAQCQVISSDNGEDLAYLLILTDRTTSRKLESRLVSELQRMVKLSGEDPLTGVANRRAFDEAIEHLQAVDPRRFGVVVVDIDDFKAINDSYGHTTGDKVLKSFAEQIKHLLREDDFLARIGGDEFAVLLPNITKVRLSEVGERLRSDLNVLLSTKRMPIRIFASLGYAHSSDDPDSVVERADRWMYCQKADRESRGLQAIAEQEERIFRRSTG
ncbi:MAG: GGDEF domain-containing protein [Armatimonadetes bacterium]|nr:GGDEF domain-containing protein [Armatimonadota bacterium]